MPPNTLVRAPLGVEVRGSFDPAWTSVLTPEALAFVAFLARHFEPARQRLLAARRERAQRFASGELPRFLDETAELRQAPWRVAPAPRDLVERQVEITAPPERKMVIHALSSGASVFMADFEDACSPTWSNLIEGQRNLCDAVRRTIESPLPDGGSLRLHERTATLVVRPRGWHLDERHVLVDGRPVSGALFDFGLFLFHNARELAARHSGPYFYLPKLESHREARLWNQVFLLAQAELGLARGTIRATVLIETLPAAFEMEEILYELREHASGLNCGRWDYIFSFIKTLRERPDCVLPDRWQVGMDRPFLESYSRLLVRTCHRRGAHAIGGMAAQIPIKGDEAANQDALAKVRADKLREVANGHDGTWVAHPGLVATARVVFHEHLRGPHQIERPESGPEVAAEDLLRPPAASISEAGLRRNARVGLSYLAAWLSGSGCVPIDHLMEDAATAEISRTQLWQWLRHRARLDDGRPVEPGLVRAIVAEEVAKLRSGDGTGRLLQRLEPARELFERLVLAPELAEFLTLPAYEVLETLEEDRCGP
jgi:malate synthase